MTRPQLLILSLGALLLQPAQAQDPGEPPAQAAPAQTTQAQDVDQAHEPSPAPPIGMGADGAGPATAVGPMSGVHARRLRDRGAAWRSGPGQCRRLLPLAGRCA